jgi:hypothetical protein
VDFLFAFSEFVRALKHALAPGSQQPEKKSLQISAVGRTFFRVAANN